MVALAIDDVGTALQHSTRAATFSREAGGVQFFAWHVLALAEATRRAKGSADARRLAIEAIEAAEQTDAGVAGCLARWISARIDRDDDQDERAAVALHEGLAFAVENGITAFVPDLLEELGLLAARRNDLSDARRLTDAAATGRAALGLARFPIANAERQSEVLQLQQVVGPDSGIEEPAGPTMTLAAAVAYVRRGRGKRRRSTTGWSSLTPTESQVVDLVIGGLTNAEIGARMFISKRTVATHLGHIFAKLNIANRAELAAKATARRERA
jgi:DNA-binding CsgD family transcriptional regulator